MALIEGEALREILPQKFPMVMVDKLLFSDEKTAVSGFTILADNIFCENGFFTQAGMLENIAQTAAI